MKKLKPFDVKGCANLHEVLEHGMHIRSLSGTLTHTYTRHMHTLYKLYPRWPTMPSLDTKVLIVSRVNLLTLHFIHMRMLSLLLHHDKLNTSVSTVVPLPLVQTSEINH